MWNWISPRRILTIVNGTLLRQVHTSTKMAKVAPVVALSHGGGEFTFTTIWI